MGAARFAFGFRAVHPCAHRFVVMVSPQLSVKGTARVSPRVPWVCPVLDLASAHALRATARNDPLGFLLRKRFLCDLQCTGVDPFALVGFRLQLVGLRRQ